MTHARMAVAIVALSLTATAPAARAADFTVDSVADAADAKPGDHVCRTPGATCTLRAAVQEADASSGADTVSVPAGRYRLTSVPAPEAGFPNEDDAGNGDLDIGDTLTVRGAGAGRTTIDGGGLDRVFSVGSSVTASISDMTITGGDAIGGGSAKGIGMGGGIYNQGAATLERLRMVGNAADGGGAIFSIPGTYITVRDSLLAHNTAYEGGAIRFDNGGEVVNSTITDNKLLVPPSDPGSVAEQPKVATTVIDEITGYGGGIDHRGGADVAIVNSTITGNHAIKGGGGVNSGQDYVPVSDKIAISRVRLLNSIIAGNTSNAGPANCHVSAQIIESAGHNLASDDSCFLTAAGDLPDHDPLLGPLAGNGGPTDTQALLAGSPGVDAAATDGCPQQDQRGVARPQGAACDIGAYERGPAAEATPASQPRQRAQVRRKHARHRRHMRHRKRTSHRHRRQHRHR
jgi:CSLREA domain-containing protein